MHKFMVMLAIGLCTAIVCVSCHSLPAGMKLSSITFSRLRYNLQYHIYRLLQYLTPELHCPMTIEAGSRCPVSKQAYPIPIWYFWDGPVSPTVEFCVATWRKYCNPEKYVIHRVSSENIKKFIDHEIHCLDNANVTLQFKSDFVRLELMSKYGGVYLDASVIMSTNFETWLFRDDMSYNCFHGVYNKKLMTVDCARPMIETSFLAAPPQHSIIIKWLQQFKTIKAPCNVTNVLDYMMSHKNVQRRNLDVTYHAVYHAFEHMLQKHHLSSHDSVRLYDNDILQFLNTNYNTDTVSESMEKKINLLKQGLVRGPLIKLVRKDRMYFDAYLQIEANKTDIEQSMRVV